MNIIDPHLHLFALSQGEYHWLKGGNPPFWPDKSKINHSYDESDIALNKDLSLAGFVHIEAGFDNQQPWRELNYLEGQCSLPFRSIAAINLLDNQIDFAASLERLRDNSSFVGVRHILDEEALSILSSHVAQTNFSHLNWGCHNHSLIFETQLDIADTPACDLLFQVMCQQQDTQFIINHMGFPSPDYQSMAWLEWQKNLKKLATLPNVAVKCSGWEMASRSYSSIWVEQCLTACLEAFTVKRVMLASNFPLCLFSKINYQSYWQELINLNAIQTLSTNEKSALCYNNALLYYQLAITENN